MAVSFRTFTGRLFPGDEIATPNAPGGLPKDVQSILDEVAKATHVPKDYLAKSARLVLDGIAGLGCLWYLHGAGGTIVSPTAGKTVSGYLPYHLGKEWFRLNKQRADAWRMGKGGRPGFEPDRISTDVKWTDGTIDEFLSYINRSTSEKYTTARTVKLGKWLRKQGASAELLHVFETRAPGKWDWKITCHPFDVLTMSFRRSWTSCMRPGGAAELGPLTDMAAGSALMLFYRPGAHVACGRLVLRPVSDEGSPGIVSGGTVYGSGPGKIRPDKLAAMLAEATGIDMPVTNDELCPAGEDGEALSRSIYSDTDRDYCTQDQEQYDDAYEVLGGISWPQAALDVGDIKNRAGHARELVESNEAGVLVDIAREIAEFWGTEGQEGPLQNIREVYENENLPSSADYDAAAEALGRELDDDEESQLSSMVDERLEEMWNETLASVRGTVFAILGDPDDQGTWPEGVRIDPGVGIYTLSNEMETYNCDHESPSWDAAYLNVDFPEDLDTDDIEFFAIFPEELYPTEMEACGLAVDLGSFGPGEYNWQLEIT